jgi:hypothetical protein
MEILIAKDKEWDEHFGVCPFCHVISAYNLECDDYVDKPMLWCGCSCARCVLDLPLEFDWNTLDKVGSFDQVRQIVPDMEREQTDQIFKESDFIFYRAKLLFILGVVNSTLSMYRSTKQLSQEEIRDFVDSGYSKEKRRELGLLEQEPDDGSYDADVDSVDMTLAIDCNSYNALEPKIPYPNNYDLNHDGIFVYLTCKNEDGVISHIKYWGD